VVSFGLAVLGAGIAAFAPLVSETSATGSPGSDVVVRTEHVSTFEVDGWWVLVVVSVPVLISLLALLIGRRWALVTAAVALWVCCILGIVSVGLFFIPSAVAMTVAAAGAARPVGTMPA
jgi:hypothetical protein